jgi:hypothetical protein
MGKAEFENRNTKLETRNALREPGMIGPGYRRVCGLLRKGKKKADSSLRSE